MQKNARKFEWNTWSKIPATISTLIYSVVNIACLNNAFSEIFELEASPVEVQSLLQKKNKKR